MTVIRNKLIVFTLLLVVQVFEEPSLLGSTFASIPDHQLDPNNTLTFINTKLGSTWYGPQTKDDFLLCKCIYIISFIWQTAGPMSNHASG